MPASPSSLIASSAAPAALCPPELTVGLPEALAAIPDPRARRGVRHCLAVVLTAADCAVVAGYRSDTAIGEWVARHLPRPTQRGHRAAHRPAARNAAAVDVPHRRRSPRHPAHFRQHRPVDADGPHRDDCRPRRHRHTRLTQHRLTGTGCPSRDHAEAASLASPGVWGAASSYPRSDSVDRLTQ